MRVRVTAFLGLVAMAACGGDDGDAASSTTTAPAPTTTATAQAAPTTTTTTVVGEDVVLGDRTVIPAENVGDVDLTALPVGETSDAPEAGRLYLCPTFPTDGGGAQVLGPWFNGDGTYDLTAKSFVLGDVAWDEGYFEVTVEDGQRVLTGNDLPVGHHTGEFPIADDDPAAEYDQNPSAITENPRPRGRGRRGAGRGVPLPRHLGVPLRRRLLPRHDHHPGPTEPAGVSRTRSV